MREGELLQRIISRSADLPSLFPNVLVGPGDDCAVVTAPGSSTPLLLKVDQVVEGRHFTPETPYDFVARKAIARAVSDIAAMAGRPLFTLVGAALPANFEQVRADALYEHLLKWSLHFGCPLVGGDTAVFDAAGGGGALTLSVTIVGTPHATRGAVLRSGAQVGDDVYLTGALGGSFLRHGPPFAGAGRHLTFEPRVREASLLVEAIGQDLHALMDISDGLGLDAARLALRSGAAIEVDAASIPLSRGVSDPLRAAADGEDYELLFTVRSGVSVPSVLGSTPVTRIGRVIPWQSSRPRCELLHHGGRTAADALGWEHAG